MNAQNQKNISPDPGTHQAVIIEKKRIFGT